MTRMDGNLARYDMRKNDDGLWTVYDVFTGSAAVVKGVTLDALDIEEADDMVDLLNAAYARRRDSEAP